MFYRLGGGLGLEREEKFSAVQEIRMLARDGQIAAGQKRAQVRRDTNSG
jgi:hypothetical protein